MTNQSPVVNSTLRMASGDEARPVLSDLHPDVITITEFMGLPTAAKTAVQVWLALSKEEFEDLCRVQICPDGVLLCHFQIWNEGSTVRLKGKRLLEGRLRKPDPRFATSPWYGTNTHRHKRLGHVIGIESLTVGEEPDPEKKEWEDLHAR